MAIDDNQTLEGREVEDFSFVENLSHCRLSELLLIHNSQIVVVEIEEKVEVVAAVSEQGEEISRVIVVVEVAAVSLQVVFALVAHGERDYGLQKVVAVI